VGVPAATTGGDAARVGVAGLTLGVARGVTVGVAASDAVTVGEAVAVGTNEVVTATDAIFAVGVAAGETDTPRVQPISSKAASSA
jgi:hypothetical protein